MCDASWSLSSSSYLSACLTLRSTWAWARSLSSHWNIKSLLNGPVKSSCICCDSISRHYSNFYEEHIEHSIRLSSHFWPSAKSFTLRHLGLTSILALFSSAAVKEAKPGSQRNIHGKDNDEDNICEWRERERKGKRERHRAKLGSWRRFLVWGRDGRRKYSKGKKGKKWKPRRQWP